MKARHVWLGCVLVAASLGGLWLAGRGAERGPSVRSAAARGWLGAYRYLEAAAGAPGSPEAGPGAPRLLEEPPGELPKSARVAVTGFPWSAHGLEPGVETWEELLRRGGALLVGYSGGLQPSRPEILLLEALGASFRIADEGPPLLPWRWWRWTREEWRIVPAEAADAPSLGLSRMRWRPVPPEGATVWFRGAGGDPVVTSWRRGRGSVVLFPAEVLANHRLEDPPHRSFLETLRRAFPGAWTFDEYHHGWGERTVAAGVAAAARTAWDRLLLQLALIYLVAAWALARRMGPAWRREPVRAGGSGAYLRRLGRLHEELGHAADAARRLLERAPALDPRIAVGEEERRRAEEAGPEDLLELARTIHRPAAKRREHDRRAI